MSLVSLILSTPPPHAFEQYIIRPICFIYVYGKNNEWKSRAFHELVSLVCVKKNSAFEKEPSNKVRFKT